MSTKCPSNSVAVAVDQDATSTGKRFVYMHNEINDKKFKELEKRVRILEKEKEANLKHLKTKF